MISEYELNNIDRRADLEIFGILTAALFMYKLKHKRQPPELKKKQKEAYKRAARYVRPGEMITMRINMNRLPNGRPDFSNLDLHFEAIIESVEKYREYCEEDDEDDDDDEYDY